MKIGFIGAGKVGTAFGIYLKNKGFHIHGYFSKTLSSAQKAAKLTDSVAVIDVNELIKHIDILFITTKDDVVESVCNNLVEKRNLSKGKILVHMSGASSSNILKKAKEVGCYIYSLHPLQAFAEVQKSVEDLENTVFSIEGDIEKIEVMENILKTLGNHYFKLTAEQKGIYHATACVVSNYLVTLMDYGLSLFSSIGIDEKEGYKALYPLIEGTIKNIDHLGTKNALTGPIARGDIGTIENHMKVIKNIKPQDLTFYKMVGLKTVELAEKQTSSDKNKLEHLKNILKEVD
ncbi:Rossmann-like and DUF2520 domain-containing protein [Marinisporobacter balticus]|uniref:Putative short-subunit dehydrogenase-like oxidoreductase (DUF2520 family) n=1 Tax=Marinisporobacter balticus TaxID=2018667 RepID=A0A4R2L4C7_9FIRM|nr:Rossmann-like and DUF2520 domain-containing protein [Marinisporobacter balticus]TCO77458.1 putative short-subunit dehydrogenase-like oxidoreductase (DUF2520 family) [Marinisporobacter balticus]